MSKNDFVFFNDAATTEIYTLSLHDSLPISRLSSVHSRPRRARERGRRVAPLFGVHGDHELGFPTPGRVRSEEHMSELQSRQYVVCRLLLENKPGNFPQS